MRSCMAAIPAMEAELSTFSRETANLAVAAIAQMPEQDAAESLVRHAVLAPWQEVRDAAIEAEHAQEVRQGAQVVALQDRQYDRGRAEAGLAGHQHVGIAVDRGERQRVVLHRVDLALEDLEIEQFSVFNAKNNLFKGYISLSF